MNIARTTQFPARMGMRAPSYGYTTNRDIHGGVQPSLTRRGRLVGDVIRGFQPTGSWVHPRWVSTHGSRSRHTPMRAGCPRSQAVRHYATIPGVAMRRGAGWDTLSPALELCVRLGLGEGRGQAESIAANTAGDEPGKTLLRGLKPVRGYVLVLGGVF
jgi:hypothetical protein